MIEYMTEKMKIVLHTLLLVRGGNGKLLLFADASANQSLSSTVSVPTWSACVLRVESALTLTIPWLSASVIWRKQPVLMLSSRIRISSARSIRTMAPDLTYSSSASKRSESLEKSSSPSPAARPSPGNRQSPKAGQPKEEKTPR